MRLRFRWADWLLAALLAWGCWAFFGAYGESAEREGIFDAESAMRQSAPAPVRPTLEAVQAEAYAALAGRLFFAPESGANAGPSVRETARGYSAPAPLPVLFGIADLGGGPTALLAPSEGAKAQWVSPGQSVGGFMLREIGDERLVFVRDGRRFAALPDELRPGRDRVPVRAAPIAGAHRRPATGTILPAGTRRRSASGGRYSVGTEFRPGQFAADANDGVADGTVYEGYVRRVRKTPFGEQHWWESRAQ